MTVTEPGEKPCVYYLAMDVKSRTSTFSWLTFSKRERGCLPGDRMHPEERLLLESLDRVLGSQPIRAQIEPIVERVTRNLASEPTAAMAWEPIPLAVFGEALPAVMRSSWVFVLRAGAITGAERHPNSHQRMMSYRAAGDLQTGGEGKWQSHPLVSDPGASLEKRWISVPPKVWHQAAVAERDWVVISFHTVSARELIEERPADENAGGLRQRHYVAAEPRPLEKNPWLEIPEADYAGHMGSEDVGQLSVLARLFHDALRLFVPADVLVLGCSSGNGFEHIDPRVTRRVTGIDINPAYLQLLTRRFPSPAFELSLECADVACYHFPAEGFDFVHVPVLFEYVEWEQLLPALARSLRPGGLLSVIMQRPSPSAPAVAHTQYASLRKLERLFRFVPPDALRALAVGAGLSIESEFEVPLKQEKAFHVLYLRRRAGNCAAAQNR